MSENTMTPVMDEPVQIVPFNSFAIYQVKDGDDYHLLRFASLESVEKEAASFRDKVRNEEARINWHGYYNRSAVVQKLRDDGFTVIPTEDTQRITVLGESLRTADFCLTFEQTSCWVSGCDTHSLDRAIRFDTYDQVYVGSIPDDKLNQPYHFLDELFTQFNTTYANDYTGRSMSVSDVIVLNINGKITSYYVEPAGFEVIPDFIPVENPLENAEMSLEDDYDMIDGIINNGEKKSVREEMNEFRNMSDAYVNPFPKDSNKKDQPEHEL